MYFENTEINKKRPGWPISKTCQCLELRYSALMIMYSASFSTSIKATYLISGDKFGIGTHDNVIMEQSKHHGTTTTTTPTTSCRISLRRGTMVIASKSSVASATTTTSTTYATSNASNDFKFFGINYWKRRLGWRRNTNEGIQRNSIFKLFSQVKHLI